MRRVAAAAVVLACLAAPIAISAAVAAAPVTAPVTTVPASASGAFAASEKITRQHINADGSTTTVDTRNFHISVDQTSSVRARQQIAVSWTGAHPSGGLVADPNNASASRQEYPVVLMECRGIDSVAAPAGQRLTPDDCWTQTPDERYQESFSTSFPEWRMDRYADPGDRRAVVDAPAPNSCDDGAITERYVPFIATDGTAYYGGANGQCGIAPEASTVQDPSAPPPDTTYAATGIDGAGQASFVIWTAQQNASLGCSDTVPCALVIIPIMGISCDAAGAGLPADQRPAPGDEADAATANCAKTGRYAPGEPFSTDVNKAFGDTAVTGALWWSASNWRNRITVPLVFAPAADACDVLDTRTPVDVYGSELMDQATVRWSALFCHDPRLFKFQQVRTGEPEAKSALAAGSISAALISRPPDGGYAVPTVNAPVAVTGFAVSYVIDDAHKHPYTTLKLNARLLAKLLSESYWGRQALQSDYRRLPASNPYSKMAGNPQDITDDPEFIKLNPGIGSTTESQAAATVLALSGDSDVMYALTSYLNTDPDARAFLDGKPDPWGMVVNPAYRKIILPQTSWPLLDTFLSPDIDLDGCLRNDKNQITPVPILPLIAAPTASLTTIAQDMQFAIANSNTNCSPLLTPGGLLVGGTLKALGREQPGARFMLGLTSLGDTALFGLRNAALQSTTSGGAHFVTPSNTSLKAAMRLTTVDPKTRTWPIPYARLRTAAGATAYPGTMVVYAAVPTTGLDQTTATDLGKLLQFAATAGQSPGDIEGQLPPGYLPMTAALGLGSLATYTATAAVAVIGQTGTVPAIGSSVGSPPTSPPAAGGGSGAGGSGAGGSGAGGSGAGGGGGNGPGAGAGRPAPSSNAVKPTFPAPYTPPVQLPAGYTAAVHSSTGGWTLPIAVLASLVCTVIAMAVRAVATMRAASNTRDRLERMVAESRSRQ